MKLRRLLPAVLCLLCLTCRFGPVGLALESGDGAVESRAEQIVESAREQGRERWDSADPSTEPEDGRATAGELISALRAGESTVTVTGDILWDVEETVTVSQPVTVELGGYGILVPEGGSLSIEGPVCFSGTGTLRPVIESLGSLSLSGGARVEAEGEEGTAVRALSLDGTFMEIAAAGGNATALELTGMEQNELACGWFRASGEGSTAVRSAGPVRLFLCRAEGETAVRAGGPVILDGSAASPAIPGASVVERVLIPGNRLRENGLCIQAGAGRDELASLYKEQLGDSLWCAAYDAAEQAVVRMLTVPADFGGLAGETPGPGTYDITCAPRLPDWFPLELAAFSIPLHVVEENTPFLWDAQDAGAGAFLRFFQEIAGAERMTLWYSLDAGKSWRDAAELPGIVILSTGAQLENLEINRTYWFRLEVEGGPMAGRSNVLEFPLYDEYHVNGGGNRDNDDRDDMGELPVGDFLVPPPEASVSSAVSSGADETGSPGGSAGSGPESGGKRKGESSSVTAGAVPAVPPGASVDSGVPKAGGTAEEAPEKAEPLLLWPFFLSAAVLLAAGAGTLALRARRAGRHSKGGRRP